MFPETLQADDHLQKASGGLQAIQGAPWNCGQGTRPLLV